MTKTHTIAFQGWPGANSDNASREAFPGCPTVPCTTFEETMAAVHDGRADVGMIPIENSVAGRVADIHHLLPNSGLFITGEHFHRVRHQLLGLPGAKIDALSSVHSHVHALNQTRTYTNKLGLERVVHADTAGAAEMVAQKGNPAMAAIASELAAEIYGLEILASDIEDAEHNTTRFIMMEREARVPPMGSGPAITSLVFQVRSVPAALFKALGGFATNGVNITKLESYLVGGGFVAAQFYADIEGHPDDAPVSRALEELDFFTTDRLILGTYAASPFRQDPAIFGELDPDPYKRRLKIVEGS